MRDGDRLVGEMRKVEVEGGQVEIRLLIVLKNRVEEWRFVF